MRSDAMRERQLNIRLSPEEAVRVDALAAHYGLNPANLMRLLIKQASDSLAPAAAETPKRPAARAGESTSAVPTPKRRKR